MPFINTKTNIEIPSAKEGRIKERLGEAVSLLGKSENYLMVCFEDQCRLYFQGKSEPAAFIEVRLFGQASSPAYDRMTKAVTDIIKEELKIPGSRIYVQYEEVPHWGFNGRNF